MLANVATAITPTCVSGTMPVGTGGTIVDGTYVLTSQTNYRRELSKAPLSFSETITIAGDCFQTVFGDILSGTCSGRLDDAGNTFTFDPDLSCTSTPTARRHAGRLDEDIHGDQHDVHALLGEHDDRRLGCFCLHPALTITRAGKGSRRVSSSKSASGSWTGSSQRPRTQT